MIRLISDHPIKIELKFGFDRNHFYVWHKSFCHYFQIRYKNPYLNPALYDSSGITLYYTSYLQRFELGNKLISVTHFKLPTGQKTTTITSEYPGECSTMQMSKPIYITGAFIHMHSYGKCYFVLIVIYNIAVVNLQFLYYNQDIISIFSNKYQDKNLIEDLIESVFLWTTIELLR